MARPNLRLAPPPAPPSPEVVVLAYLRLLVDLRDAARCHDQAWARYTVKRGLGTPDSQPSTVEEDTLLIEASRARRALDAVWLRIETFEREHNRFSVMIEAATLLAPHPSRSPDGPGDGGDHG